MTIRRAAIVAPMRTPVGTFGGSLRAVPVEELAATAIKAVLEQTGIDPGLVDDVSFAQSYVNGETPCIGRWAALHAGLPVSVPGLQIDRRCGGGLQAVVTAAMMVQTGAADVVLAGGAESMSRGLYGLPAQRWGARMGNVDTDDLMVGALTDPFDEKDARRVEFGPARSTCVREPPSRLRTDTRPHEPEGDTRCDS